MVIARAASILCEAAQKAKQHSDFAASYQAIAGRRDTKIATTAIARACHLLTDASSAGAPEPPPGNYAQRPPAEPAPTRPGRPALRITRHCA